MADWHSVSFISQSHDLSSYGFKTEGQPCQTTQFGISTSKSPTCRRWFPPEKVCQFYSLAPYLDRGFTVDDITTAIQTGWKMAGVDPAPELNYHKETKLLIAYGEPNELQTIQQVLQTLPSVNQVKIFGDRQIIISANCRQQVDQLKKQLAAAPAAPSLHTSPDAEKSGK